MMALFVTVTLVIFQVASENDYFRMQCRWIFKATTLDY